MTITLEGVSLCYRLARQRVPSLKEYAIHFLKGSLSYQKLWALKDIDLQIAAGETVGIVGRNGAGKSTLLKVISGVFKPTEGRINVEGAVAPLLELGTGFDYELTGHENIFLNGLLLGHSRKEVSDRIDDIIAFAELENFIHSPIRNYSTGMIGRLGFAIATAWETEILIVDEILSVGDQAFQKKSAERMSRFREHGTTVLLVSHSGTAIREQCDRCVWLDSGQLIADGDPEDVMGRYESQIFATSSEPAH